ncbi:SprT-like protein [Streptococcus saliviloxodontae]|uniref:SprT-like protein n=1 Tax=Streptococcus saliviloxodontae TaxID=1349416 RepID=A0ABS2PLS0_9STRE|nr:SprT-like protein [Streptococcus saliviloxodontae]
MSIEDFGKPFCHQAMWNSRLRTTGGRFFPKDGHLDFNPKLYHTYGLEVFRRIVRHELCHYHLYYEKKGYRHADSDFKTLLRQVDGLRYAPSIPSQKVAYQYRCQQCGQTYARKRRVDTSKYACGNCHGRLELI